MVLGTGRGSTFTNCRGDVKQCFSDASQYETNTTSTSKQSLDSRLRNFALRTNLDLFLIGVVLALFHACGVYAAEDSHGDAITTAADGHDGDSGHSEVDITDEQKTEVYAVLFPW